MPKIEPWPVFGGYRPARSWWVLERGEDWWQEHRFVGETIYPTAADCKAAIEKGIHDGPNEPQAGVAADLHGDAGPL